MTNPPQIETERSTAGRERRQVQQQGREMIAQSKVTGLSSLLRIYGSKMIAQKLEFQTSAASRVKHSQPANQGRVTFFQMRGHLIKRAARVPGKVQVAGH
eukprot:1144894-Pelagomonas_calceolata.AAC.8